MVIYMTNMITLMTGLSYQQMVLILILLDYMEEPATGGQSQELQQGAADTAAAGMAPPAPAPGAAPPAETPPAEGAV